MSKRKSFPIFFQTKISSLKIEIGCQTWGKSNLRLLEWCSWGKLNWNVISGRWTPFKITNIPAAWMVDSYEYSGIKKPTSADMRAITHYNWQNAFQGGGDLWGFNLNGMINWTRPFMLYWFQEISTIFFAGLHSTAFQRKFHSDNVCWITLKFSLRILCWIANMLTSFRIPNMYERGVFWNLLLIYHIFMAFMRDHGYQNNCVRL